MINIAEHFYSIQGEGANSGKAAYFIRLSGCDVGCTWCDSLFAWKVGGGEAFSESDIVNKVVASGAKAAVITGGEPLMQNLDVLTGMLKDKGVEVWIETSGTKPFSGVFDWVCLSPKKFKKPLDDAFKRASELKVVIGNKEDFLWAEECAKKVGSQCKLLLQPEWNVEANMLSQIIEYVKCNQMWKISLQTHKYMNIR
ncbi:MAG: 7-carboxy-7-deazaguanine synthase QueE [Rikenellaceae bacterium]